MIRRDLSVGGLLLCLALTAAAQDASRIETFLGYSYARFYSTSGVPSFSASGGGAQFTYNFNKWIGGVFDAGAVHNGDVSGVNRDATIANFVGGPRFSYRTRHLHPYVQALWGGAYATGWITSQTAFAMTAGGGLDISINKRVSFRPVALDYCLTRLNNNNQNSLRYTTGFNFAFGAR